MTDMTAFHPSTRSNRHADVPAFWFAGIFALISYATISMRAVLNPYELHYLFDLKRFISVAVGASILCIVISSAQRQSSNGPRAQMLVALNVAIPGMICLLLAREIYDLVVSGELAQRFAHNLRWMLTWVGYFIAAVAAFFAFSYYRQLQDVTRRIASPLSVPEAKDSDDIKTLLMVLRAQTGYEVADVNVGPNAAARDERLARIDRALDRLAS